jgi:hypothetical protein
VINFFSKWKDKITQYVDVRIQLFKLEFIEKTSNVLSYIIFSFVMLLITMSILIFLGIGLGEWLCEVLHTRTGGFFATAGIYIIFMLIIFGFRKQLVRAFSSMFIRILTDDKDHQEDK